MKNKFLKDTIYVVETNIDDMNPMIYETVFEKLYSSGALEVFLTPVQMKKIRPGILLTILTPKNKLKKIAEVVFRETTSFGIRYHKTERLKLIRRKTKNSDICCGIKMNKGYIGKELVRISPEYNDCRKLAVMKKKPIKNVLWQSKVKL